MKFKREVASAILRELLTSNSSIEEVPDVSHDDFLFHSLMLKDAGLIVGGTDFRGVFEAERITWLGYARLSEFDEALGKEYDPKNFVRNFQRA